MRKTFKTLGIIIIIVIIGYVFKLVNDYSFSGNKDIKIIENYDKILTLSELIQRDKFKNKVLYIDLWGVHCKPCIKEFKHLPELKERYKNSDVEFIYLASPYKRINDTQEWKTAIKKYDLHGYNLLMNIDFYYDIWEEVPEMKNKYNIPHFLLVDKNGKIVNSNAPKPSNKSELYKEINKLL